MASNQQTFWQDVRDELATIFWFLTKQCKYCGKRYFTEQAYDACCKVYKDNNVPPPAYPGGYNCGTTYNPRGLRHDHTRVPPD